MAFKLRLLKPYLPVNMNLNPGVAASWVQSSHREIPIFSGGARRAVHELSHLNSEKIGLPKSRVLYTVLRSPHIDKKSREQFHMGIKKQILVTKSQRHELRNKYFWLMRQRIFGAQCEIQFSYKTRLGVRKFSTLRPSKSFIEHPTTGFDQCSVSPFSLKGIKNAEYEKMTMVRQICHTALKGDHEFINTVQEGTEETHAQVGRASHVEMKNEETAYQAWLGYYNSNKKVGRDKHRLVEVANEFSRRMGLDNPLAIPKLILGKMGL